MTVEGEESGPQAPPGLPGLECDIVMAGGVTSGVIYPGAVAMIAQRFCFRSIGGTSVGAIAAAITAAAEYGRHRRSNPDAFATIAKMPASLGEQSAQGHSRLFHLFTPEEATDPLFHLAAPLFQGGGILTKVSGLLAASLASLWISLPVALAALAGLVLAAALAWAGQGLLTVLAVLAAIALVLLVWVAALGLMLRYRWLPAMRDNGYGICTGMASPSAEAGADFEGLTPWINRQVQAAAGRPIDGPPLTFGDLWDPFAPPSEVDGPAERGELQPRQIELAMIASDISRNRSMQLPFIEFPTPVYLRIKDLERYFPPHIVAWMLKYQGEAVDHVEKNDDFIRLPKPGRLPVVFGARLSLSFPFLLTAIRLWAPDFRQASKGESAKLRPLWFSDGGLTSNFPIHFFDSPLPSRPTFGLNLVAYGTALPEDAAQAPGIAAAQAEDPDRLAQNRVKRTPGEAPLAEPPPPGDEIWRLVTMSRGNRFDPPPFIDFESKTGPGLGAFVSTLLNTARFWSDNQLLIAPGVRDRVVNIALKDDEGGLNLDMKPEVILDLDQRGQAAGLLIAARFDPEARQDPRTGGPPERRFINHRWVRYRNFMGGFEDMSRRYSRAWRSSDASAGQRGEPVLTDLIDGKAAADHGYDIPEGVRGFYRDFTQELDDLALRMAAVTRAEPAKTFDLSPPAGGDGRDDSAAAAPRPRMRLQLRPVASADPAARSAPLPDKPEGGT